MEALRIPEGIVVTFEHFDGYWWQQDCASFYNSYG